MIPAILTLTKIGKIVGIAIAAIEAAKGLKKLFQKSEENLPKGPPLAEETSPINKVYDEKLNMCFQALSQHVKAINRNSDSIKEQNEMIGKLISQNEQLAIALKDISKWTTILMWSIGFSLVISIVAILISIIK